MKKIRFIRSIIFSFSILPVLAVDTDSLFMKLEQAGSVGEKIEICKNAGEAFHEDKRLYSEALFFYEKGLSFSEKKGDKAFFNQRIGYLFVDSTNYSKALEHLRISLSLYKELKDKSKYPVVYNLIGMCYGLSNNLDSAIIAFESAMEINKELNDSSALGYNYYNIGLAQLFKGNYDEAVENYIQSANYRQHLPNNSAFITSLTSIGEVFRIKEEYANALIYYNKALESRKSITDKQLLAYLYSEMALIYKNKEDFPTANAYIDTALVFSREIGYKRGVATLTSYRAGIFKKQGDNNKAAVLYSDALDQYHEIGFEIGIVQANIALAKIDHSKGDLNSALKRLLAVEEAAEKNHLLDESNEIAELKFTCYKELQQYKAAIKAADRLMILKDSIFNIEKEEKINDILTRYRTTEKEKQIELLDKENRLKGQMLRSRKNLMVALIVFSLLIIVVIVLFARQVQLKSRLQIEKGRQKLLRSQMNPHFVYNSLSAIQNFILYNNPIDSVTYISEFSSLMRLVLEGSRNDFVLLKDDIKLNSNFLKLQQLRFSQAFKYDINVDEKLDTELIKIPPMLSQPFIENAVEHGIRNLKPDEGYVCINYQLKNSALQISISDNGAGINQETGGGNKKHKSMATQITNERIENIKKTHRLSISMQVISEAMKGTLVVMTIPFLKTK